MCCKGSLREVSQDSRSTRRSALWSSPCCLALAFSIVVFWIIGQHSTALRNCWVIRQLLFFTANLIFSFRAQHTGTKR
ncbi:hypothetical protein H5410_030851 [Solanum commersonii]|uniref:Uncharacterized protein n=1 Tax=Solanum commersonii TaxID=4109 RepID=A0A9J5YGV7_SOLCO|nr:hypothetical protein H5410_030851 [Solanum commersonii]